MTESKQVVIIGGGVIGLCAAYYCARRGHRVTVIERGSEARDGCSFGNAGMIVPSHFVPLAAPGMVALGLKWMWNPESPFYIKPRLDWELLDWGFKFWRAANADQVRRAAPFLRDLSFASRAEYEELAAGSTNGFGLVQRGLLMLCESQHALDEEAKFAAQANALGVPAEVLDARQTAARDPDATMRVAGSVYFPKDCHLSPARFMADLLQQCKAMAVMFSWETKVLGFVRAGLGPPPRQALAESSTGKPVAAVLTDQGEIEADEFVLCGGSWSPGLARELGLKIPLQAGKGYSLTLPRPRQLPRLCSILAEARVAVTPMDGSLRFGGTMEIAGLNEDINSARVQGIVKAAVQYFPEFRVEDFAGIPPWRGLRPCSPDGLPYLGRTARFPNLTLATGHAMMGLSLGPITGRLVAEIISGERPQFELTLLSPDRYG